MIRSDRRLTCLVGGFLFFEVAVLLSLLGLSVSMRRMLAEILARMAGDR